MTDIYETTDDALERSKSKVLGQHQPNTLEQFYDVASRAVRAALLPDGHYGYVMPVGGVAAYRNQVSVVGVGYDIGCGNCALRTEVTIDAVGRTLRQRENTLTRWADHIAETISFGLGRKNTADDAPVDHPLFDDSEWLRLRERAGHGEWRRLKDIARTQLGTVGGGNHYVDVFVDESGYIWVGVHFGSRGFGHQTAQGFLNAAVTGDWFAKAPEQEVLLDLASSLGQDYWALMTLAGQYASAGREWVARKVVSLLEGRVQEVVHNHHNFAWREQHQTEFGEEELVVVRKGATPAWPGQRGFVGGSMGDNAVILRGMQSDGVVRSAQQALLFSTVHGAGRVMSRTEAAGKRNRRTGELILDEAGQPKKPGKVDPAEMEAWLKRCGVIRRGGDVDEAPQCYRRLIEVLLELGPTVEIQHVLRPLVVCMAPKGVVDPFKD